jgi:hypothetical protein
MPGKLIMQWKHSMKPGHMESAVLRRKGREAITQAEGSSTH